MLITYNGSSVRDHYFKNLKQDETRVNIALHPYFLQDAKSDTEVKDNILACIYTQQEFSLGV